MIAALRPRDVVLLAAAVAVVAFLPSLRAGFVYDDHRFVVGNAQLDDVSVLWRAFADPAVQTADGTHAGLWRPLRTLSFALDRALFGDAAWGPHLVNVLLHGAGTAGVAGLLLRWGARPWAALLGALVYALHPVQIECVAWVSSRGDLLAAALVWSALLAELSGRQALALAAGAGALLAKGQQAAVWPALAFLSALLARRGAREGGISALRAGVCTAVLVGLPLLLLHEPFQEGGLEQGVASARALASMLAHQMAFTLVPVDSVFDWQLPRPDAPPFPAVVVALGALGAVGFRPTRVAAVWFLVALAPTLFVQAFVPLNILVAERFLLFALPALAWLVARGVTSAPRAALPAAVAVASLAVLTETRIPVWRSDESLWGDVAARDPRHPRARHWLGTAALRNGDLAVAVEHLRAAAATDVAGAKTRFHLASALEALGRREKDVDLIEEALTEYVMADLLFEGRRAEGREHLQPLAWLASTDLAVLLGRTEVARTAVERVLAKPRPEVPEVAATAWRNRVESLARAIDADPALGPALSARVRAWGRIE